MFILCCPLLSFHFNQPIPSRDLKYCKSIVKELFNILVLYSVHCTVRVSGTLYSCCSINSNYMLLDNPTVSFISFRSTTVSAAPYPCCSIHSNYLLLPVSAVPYIQTICCSLSLLLPSVRLSAAPCPCCSIHSDYLLLPAPAVPFIQTICCSLSLLFYSF